MKCEILPYATESVFFIKPENLIFASAENDAPLKVVDFGFAHELNGDPMTTPCFTARWVGLCVERKKF